MTAEEVRQSLTDEQIIKLVQSLGADRYQNLDSYIIFPTICHNEDPDQASMKLYYYKDRKIFHCYTECSSSFTIFTLFEKRYELLGKKYDFYSDIFYPIMNKSGITTVIEGFAPEKYKSLKSKYQKKTHLIELPDYPVGLLEMFTKQYYDGWIMEGITEESMEKFDIRYSISQNKIIIPHFDANNRLIGIRGRALNQEEVKTYGKYAPIKIENTIYRHPLSMNLYGLNLTKEAINKERKVILFEGEKSCIHMDSLFRDNYSVAVCGSQFNKAQLELLLKTCSFDEIIIGFDKEYSEPNSEKGRNYFEKLWNIGKKYSHYSNFSFIFDKEGLLDQKDSPIDRGKKVFLQLLEDRIYIK